MSAPKPFAGFTLVELIVVIAILAILMAISVSIYGNAIRSARITQRVADLKSIETALNLYLSKNDIYPTTSGVWRSECGAWGGYNSDDVIPGLAPTYIRAFPSDPKMDPVANTACYIYWSDGEDYKLSLVNVLDMQSDDFISQKNLIDPARDGGVNSCLIDGSTVSAWAIYSNGACGQ